MNTDPKHWPEPPFLPGARAVFLVRLLLLLLFLLDYKICYLNLDCILIFFSEGVWVVVGVLGRHWGRGVVGGQGGRGQGVLEGQGRGVVGGQEGRGQGVVEDFGWGGGRWGAVRGLGRGGQRRGGGQRGGEGQRGGWQQLGGQKRRRGVVGGGRGQGVEGGLGQGGGGQRRRQRGGWQQWGGRRQRRGVVGGGPGQGVVGGLRRGRGGGWGALYVRGGGATATR